MAFPFEFEISLHHFSTSLDFFFASGLSVRASFTVCDDGEREYCIFTAAAVLDAAAQL